MRYYFHLHNDIDAEDEEGSELADDRAALEHAQTVARLMAAESVKEGHLDLSHHVDVADAAGEVLFKVSFGEVITITGEAPR